MANVRAFIAIEMGEAVVARVARMQENLRETGARVKWVRRENLHITVKFLGDIEYEKVSEISKVITGAVADIAPFVMTIKGAGSFPGGGRAPRVVWAGMEGDTKSLEEIHGRLNKGLTRFGVPFEKRRFSPHITIGRVKSSGGTAGLIEDINRHGDDEFGDVEASELVFMQSELTGKGPVYIALAHIPFGKS